MSRVEVIAQLLGVAANAATSTLDEATAIAALITNAGNDAELMQWINFARGEQVQAHLSFLDSVLAKKSYLVGEFFSVADAAVLHKIHADKAIEAALSLTHVSRWLAHVQTQVKPNVLPSVTLPEVKLPLLVFACSSSSSSSAPATTASTATAAAAPEAASAAAKESVEKKDKASKAEKPAAEAATTTVAQPPAAPAAAAEAADPSKLDMRVGVVVKCWNHPDSDKLLCEEIDLGEGTNRQIASGIRAFYSAEEVQGQKVLVLANLKERSIAGFKSQGMVLCAANSDKSNVKLLQVPADAAIGARVTFEGFSGEAATPAQMAKKKIFEALAPLVSCSY